MNYCTIILYNTQDQYQWIPKEYLINTLHISGAATVLRKLISADEKETYYILNIQNNKAFLLIQSLSSCNYIDVAFYESIESAEEGIRTDVIAIPYYD